MNKIINYLTLFFIAFYIKNLQAQTGIIIGVNAFGYKSNLYNKYDYKADERINYIRSYGNSYGFELGWQFNKTFGITINPKLSSVNQKYSGDALNLLGKHKTQIETNLNYTTIPFKVHANFGNRRLKLATSLGLQYWRLKKYTDFFKAEYPIHLSENNIDRTISNNNYVFNYTHTFVPIQSVANLNKFIYSKDLWGANAGVGVIFDMYKTLQLYTKISTEYTFFDVEYKEDIIAKSQTGTSIFTNDIFRPHELPVKYTLGSDPTIEERLNTHIFNVGVQFGIRFIIPQ